MIFDTHAHYDDKRFACDRDELIGKVLPENGVSGIVTCGTNMKNCKTAIELAEKYDYVYAAVGVYPEELEKGVDYEELRRMAQHKKVVAIGEVGLEYHYDTVPHDIQKRELEKHIILANELSMPVIIHDREAHADTLELLKKHRPNGVIHCFSGSVEFAKEILKLGMYIGLGGVVTFKNARVPVEAAKFVPIDRLVLETDAPYMSPVPHRGERCDSSMIRFTAEKIAEIKGMSIENILDVTEQNAKRLFRIE